MFRIWMIIFAMVSTQAFAARKAKREGFNFGSTLGFEGGSEPTIVPNTMGQRQTDEREQKRYKAHLGYCFSGIFNLGLGVDMEQSKQTSTIVGHEPGQTSRFEGERNLGGGFLFGRVNFGQLFYMQAGAGFYERTIRLSSQSEMDSAGNFSGYREKWNLKANGLGYHTSVGIEIPVALGFYATGDYTIRTLMLRKQISSDNTAEYAGKEEFRNINFGVTHYY